jgi:AcrR family transcriptional regulator
VSQSNIARRRDQARREASPAYREKREQVMRAANELFKEKGFAATTLNDVAERVGMDRASLYYYFHSKEELLQEAVSAVMTANLEMLRTLRDSVGTPEDRIGQLIKNTMTSFHENFPQVFVYLQESDLGRRKDPWAKEMLTLTREFEEALLGLLSDAADAGSIRGDLDLNLVAQAFWGMINWTHRWYRVGVHDPDEVAAVFTTVFLHGIVEQR